MSFSLNLLRHIRDVLASRGELYEIRRFAFSIGKELGPGESTANSIYVLCSRKSGSALRICLMHDFAQELCDWDSRYLAQGQIVKVESVIE